MELKQFRFQWRLIDFDFNPIQVRFQFDTTVEAIQGCSPFERCRVFGLLNHAHSVASITFVSDSFTEFHELETTWILWFRATRSLDMALRWLRRIFRRMGAAKAPF